MVNFRINWDNLVKAIVIAVLSTLLGAFKGDEIKAALTHAIADLEAKPLTSTNMIDRVMKYHSDTPDLVDLFEKCQSSQEVYDQLKDMYGDV